MTITANDAPEDLVCGPIDQDFLDNLNGYRNFVFQQLLGIQNTLAGFQQDTLDAINAALAGFAQQLNQIREDLPEIACNEISPRFVFINAIKTGASASITLPSGGSYVGIFSVNLAEEGVSLFGKNWIYGEGNTDDDRMACGSKTGVFSGGHTESISVSAGGFKGSFTFFGYRNDC